jgi:hypothetical protein
MAVTVGKNLTDISLNEATTNWAVDPNAGSNTPTLSLAPPDDVKIQGSYSISSYNASGNIRGHRYDLGAGGTNLSNQNIYCWFCCSNKANIPAIGTSGMRIRVYDTSGNYSEWDIFGGTSLPHNAWLPWVVNTAITPSRSSATPATLTAIRYVGWICGGSTTVSSKTWIWHDAWRYGTGLTVKGGDSGAPASLADVYAYDVANACGVIDKINGVYFLQGKLQIGSTTSGDVTYFKDTSDVIVFKDSPIPNGFYDISLVGNATANTEVYFGALSGGRGITGCLFRCANPSQTPKFTITASNTSVTKFGFYGCTFLNAGTITGQAYNADKQFIDCNIQASAAMEPGTGKVQYCNFISAAGSALKLASITHHTDYCNFISCVDGVEITAAGDAYPFSALMFSGCTYDVKNSGASAAVYIDPSNSSNVSTHHETAGGSTTINFPQITLTITDLVTGSDVVIYDAGTETVLDDAQENAGTTWPFYYSDLVDSYIDIGVFLAGYRPKYVRNYLLGATNASLPAKQTIDPDYIS